MNTKEQNSDKPSILFDKVCKAYGPLKVLVDLDFAVGEGEVVSLIGPSGVRQDYSAAGVDDA